VCACVYECMCVCVLDMYIDIYIYIYIYIHMYNELVLVCCVALLCIFSQAPLARQCRAPCVRVTRSLAHPCEHSSMHVHGQGGQDP